MLDFWETIRGTRLADTLTRKLPKLTVKKKQRIEPVDDVTFVQNETNPRWTRTKKTKEKQNKWKIRIRK